MTLLAAVLAAAVVLLAALRLAPRRSRSIDVHVGSRHSRRPGVRRHSSAVRRSAWALTLAVTAVVAGVVIALIVVVIELFRQRVSQRRTASRMKRTIEGGFPDFVDLLVLTLSAGCTMLQAFTALEPSLDGPFRDTVAEVVHRVSAGSRLADALQLLPQRLGVVAQPLADSLALSDRYGTPLAPTMLRLAGEARDHRRRTADAAARRLPITLSFPLVGCTLPSFVLLTVVPLIAGTFSSLRALSP